MEALWATWGGLIITSGQLTNAACHGLSQCAYFSKLHCFSGHSLENFSFLTLFGSHIQHVNINIINQNKLTKTNLLSCNFHGIFTNMSAGCTIKPGGLHVDCGLCIGRP
jgi:hypothetical protein